MKKCFIFVLGMIIIIPLIIKGFGNKNNNEIIQNKNNEIDNSRIINGITENISENLKQTKQVENLEITDINLVREDETTKFIAVVHNNTENKFDGSNAIVNFINENGDVYYELFIYIPEINSNDIGEINAALPDDITNAYDFRISLNKEIKK